MIQIALSCSHYAFESDLLSSQDLLMEMFQLKEFITLARTLSSKSFIASIDRSRMNWLGIPVEEILHRDLMFFKSL